MKGIKANNLLSRLVILILLLGFIYTYKSYEKNLETQASEAADFADYSFFTHPQIVKPDIDNKVQSLREFMAFGIPILDSLEDEINNVQDAADPLESEEFEQLQIAINSYTNLIHTKCIELLNEDSLIYDVNLSFNFTGAGERYVSLGPQPSSEVNSINEMRSACLSTGQFHSIIWQTDTLSGTGREIKVQRMAGTCENENETKPTIFYKASAEAKKENSHGLRVSFSFYLPEDIKYLDKGWKE